MTVWESRGDAETGTTVLCSEQNDLLGGGGGHMETFHS